MIFEKKIFWQVKCTWVSRAINEKISGSESGLRVDEKVVHPVLHSELMITSYTKSVSRWFSTEHVLKVLARISFLDILTCRLESNYWSERKIKQVALTFSEMQISYKLENPGNLHINIYVYTYVWGPSTLPLCQLLDIFVRVCKWR